MNAGELDRSITIQQPTYAADDYGDGSVPTYSTYKTRKAKLEFVRGSESYESDQKMGFIGVKFTIRRDSETVSVDETYRIVFNGDTYEIESIYEDTDKRRKGWLVIEAVKRAAVDA